MNAKSTLIKLNNGVEIPAIGFGVYQIPPRETEQAVTLAFQEGYRLVDTAKFYGNEAQVGKAVKNCGFKREELFVTTKLWMTDYGFEPALKAFELSLKKLKLDYLDLYLLHWPTKTFEMSIQAYKALEKLLAEGRIKAIGVSNFTSEQLDELMKHCKVVPAVNQIELHPYFSQEQLRQKNNSLGIVTQAWSPIGGIARRGSKGEDPLIDPVIQSISHAHHKTAAQIILRWHFQNKVIAIPKSVDPKRIAENIDIFNFSLSATEMERINALDRKQRIGGDPTQTDIHSFS